MSWKTVKLKEVCHLEKGNTGIMKAIPGDYPMVTMAEERKTHNEYQFDAKAIVIPMVSGSGHGKASINRIHYQEGKFAVGTILCAVIPKDHNVLEPLFLYHYCDVFKEELFVPLMRGMANVTLPMKALEALEIPLPSIDFQRKWVQKFEHISEKQTELLTELTHQQTLLTRLHQSILQEAVQGQLTAQWRQANPHQEPASELLRRIREEKAATGKKEKPLPPVKAEEMPFELPEGWVWCRLGDLGLDFDYGTSQKADLNSSHVPVLRMNNIYEGAVVLDDLKYVSPNLKDLPRLYLEEGDILFNRTNSYELVGKSGVFKEQSKRYTFASYLIRISLPKSIAPDYINFFINSKVGRETQLEPGIIQQNGQANFNGTKLKNILIPLPPLPEQAAIVAQVERLLGLVGQLEAEAAGQREQAEGLLQAALREAVGA
jgi:type I restriction enzyme, S subunit